MNKGLGLFSSICPSAGHLQAFHTTTGALKVEGERPIIRPRDRYQHCRLHPDPCPSRHCSRKATAGSYLDNMLQLDDVACVPQARRLAPCQALIAWLWFLEVGSRVDTRGCKFRKVQEASIPTPVSGKAWFVLCTT